jgi:hypothetical protein
MKKHRHLFTPIAPTAEGGPVWHWCIRCGCLRLGKEIFAPGPHQHMVIHSSIFPKEK